MAEPLILEPPPPDTGQVNVTLNVGAVRQPNGKHWVRLEVLCGNTGYMLVVPPDTADQLTVGLPAALGQGITAARRADLGLLIAPANGHIPPLT